MPSPRADCPSCSRIARAAPLPCPVCAGSRTGLDLCAAIVGAADGAASLDEFRDAALSLTRSALDAAVGVFATFGEGSPATTTAGLAPELVARAARRWDVYGRDVAPVNQAATAGAATDRRVLGDALRRTHVYRELMAPAGGNESLIIGLAFGGRRLGLFMVGRTGGRRFSDAELGLAASLAPILSVSCAAAAHAAAPASASLRVAIPPRGGDPLGPPKLSPTEADLIRYLELGYTSREIAIARGTSFYTVRNQLSALYAKLGVANRTEAVGLRVLRSG